LYSNFVQCAIINVYSQGFVFSFTKSIDAPVGNLECQMMFWQDFFEYNPSMPKTHFETNYKLDQMVIESFLQNQ